LGVIDVKLVNFTSPQPLSRGRGAKPNNINSLPPSLSGEGGRGMRLKILKQKSQLLNELAFNILSSLYK